MTVKVIGEWCLPALMCTHEPFTVFSLPCAVKDQGFWWTHVILTEPLPQPGTITLHASETMHTENCQISHTEAAFQPSTPEDQDLHLEPQTLLAIWHLSVGNTYIILLHLMLLELSRQERQEFDTEKPSNKDTQLCSALCDWKYRGLRFRSAYTDVKLLKNPP